MQVFNSVLILIFRFVCPDTKVTVEEVAPIAFAFFCRVSLVSRRILMRASPREVTGNEEVAPGNCRTKRPGSGEADSDASPWGVWNSRCWMGVVAFKTAATDVESLGSTALEVSRKVYNAARARQSVIASTIARDFRFTLEGYRGIAEVAGLSFWHESTAHRNYY